MDKNKLVHEEIIPYKFKKFLFNLAKTISIFILTIAFSEILFFFDFDSQFLIMIYISSVLIISKITSDYFYGILAAVLDSFAYDFLISEPRMGLSFTVSFIIIFCIMLVFALLAIKIKQQTRLATEYKQKASLIYEINQRLLSVQDSKSIITITNDYLNSYLRRSVIFYTKDPLLSESGIFEQCSYESNDEAIFNSKQELEAAHKIYVNPMLNNYDDSFKNPIYYVPVVLREKVLGLIGIDCVKNPLNSSEILFIQTLATQVALVLELNHLSDKLVNTETEKSRATLLRAISHDLRTPLTSILGISSTILAKKKLLSSETCYNLISDIKTNAQWLIRIVENLLSITKISHGALKLNKTLEAAEEVVSQAVSIVRKHFPDCDVYIKGSENLLLIPMEATLISQVIINLLENSIKNSTKGSPILLEIKSCDDYAEFSISDSGRGIPEQIIDNIFDMYITDSNGSTTSSSGMGIGLSICKTIINIHGGTIMGKNNPDSGAHFSFFLPLKECENVEQRN